MAIGLWASHFKRLLPYAQLHTLLAQGAIRRFFQVNRDIFLRTLCLVAVTMYFTSAGAAQGDVILAVNTLLMHFFTFFSYIMDGFAYSGEALAGKYIGANNRPALQQMVRQLFIWGIGLALASTLIYGIGGETFLGLITNEQNVIASSSTYFYWVLAIPLAGFAAFLYDGIFIGATATNLMLRAMAIASAAFFGIYFGCKGLMGNHALWLAFITYLLLRGVMQGVYYHRVIQSKAKNLST
jgi:MATE family multidrug resistance protein